ncbi:DUF4870 domain-containing protein [Chitinophaga agrisoli]|uniref:DUF4870 domain-containing protein n=1 Tax=Chitinophaga agrisoli TaxID=2607653 RepID=A0A5B2VV10_9BACT|nr:DUF4870 domain-containing protein [Chitinophaga agrisoli]KAA2242510.1 DUF4870 domain-containing protein [Chitinophaga agrisoli]
MDHKEEKTWGALVHLGGIIGMAILSHVGNIIGALVMWLIKRNDSAFIDNQGKEALNFQITLSFINVAIGVLYGIRHGVWAFRHMWDNDFSFRHIDFFTFSSAYGIVWLLNIIFSIIGAVRANKGEAYRYPISWRIVK